MAAQRYVNHEGSWRKLRCKKTSFFTRKIQKVNSNRPSIVIGEQEVYIRDGQLGGKDGSALVKFNSDARYVVIAKSISQVKLFLMAIFDLDFPILQQGIIRDRGN